MRASAQTGSLRTAALFAGIGGIEAGLEAAEHRTDFLCEWDDDARLVLRHRFPGVPLVGDIASVEEMPAVDLVTAGFPCQDLSQAGRTAGISGDRSGLIGHVFRLLDEASTSPTWLLLENVSFMLSLDKGEAMRWLTEQLEARGYTWAYRVVDSRAFGLPQRRKRVLLLASRTEDPRPILLNQDHGEVEIKDRSGLACGFYWTEGTRGLGWAIDAIPTLKGGSNLGIPSPPAIWQTGSGKLVTPELRDAERLQGFPADWTVAADMTDAPRKTGRWKLIGNAVSLPVAQWLGERLKSGETYSSPGEAQLKSDSRWPASAWGRRGERYLVDVSTWPVAYSRPHLHDFLAYEPKLLSVRATTGFLSRATQSSLRIPDDLICEANAHLETMGAPPRIAAAA